MTGEQDWVRNAVGRVAPDANLSGLKVTAILAEATEALLGMDANRLEELAQCCQDLNRSLGPSERQAAGCELAEVPVEIETLRRILSETRANLVVLTRVRLLGVGGTRGGQRLVWGLSRQEGEYGDD